MTARLGCPGQGAVELGGIAAGQVRAAAVAGADHVPARAGEV